MSGLCAAGTKLPRFGPCPKCGVGPASPCPEAHRIAYEERDALVKAMEKINVAAHKGSLTPAERLQDIRLILNAVGTLPVDK